MALTPYVEEYEMQTLDIQTSRTYGFDVEAGEFTFEMVDNEKALRQYCAKALKTTRFRYLIYDDVYGSEVATLIGQDVTSEFMEAELPRLIREALIYDDRIEDVYDIEILKEGDTVFISFSILTSEGFKFREEVRI